MSADDIIDQKKQQAVAELNAYREQRRREREARERANQTAEDEIAETMRARRAEEERVAQVRAAHAHLMQQHEAKVAAAREEDRQRRLDADPRLRITEHPARRVALMLRRHLGENFDSVVTELRTVDLK